MAVDLPLIRDFNGLPKWHPAIAESRIEGNWPSDRVGCIRNFRLTDGGVIREQLLTLSDYEYQCTYSILESPMGVQNYIATLKLTPVTDGNRTFAEWSAEFDAPPAQERRLADERRRILPFRRAWWDRHGLRRPEEWRRWRRQRSTERRRPGRLAWAQASALTAGRMRWVACG